MSDYFPQDVLVQILSKLPVQSLLKFRCVCKSWNSVITNPNFINTHLNQSHKNTHLLIKYFSPSTKREIYSLRSDSETLDELSVLQNPFRTKNKRFFRAIGICNGLICLSDEVFFYTGTIIIWNPSIRKFLSLPPPRVVFDVYGPYMSVLGFGFDSRNNDYKVVRVSYLQNKMGSWDINAGPESLLWGGDDGYIVPPEVDVFSLATGEWKTIDSGVPSYNVVEFLWSSCFLNGFVHWVAYYRGKKLNSRPKPNPDQKNHGFRNVIMLFDMENEVFHEIKLPERLSCEYPLNLAIGVLGCGDKSTISVFQYDQRPLGEVCSVWVMEKYGVEESWKLQFNVTVDKIGTTLGFRKSGELLLTKLGNGEVVSYDPRNKAIKSLRFRCGRDSIFVGEFAESLVLLDNVNNGIGTLTIEEEFCDTFACREEEHDVLSGSDERSVLFALEKHALRHFAFAITFLVE